MDSPQYFRRSSEYFPEVFSFKPYYKWIVLNTKDFGDFREPISVEVEF